MGHQSAIVSLFRSVGCVVKVMSDHRRSSVPGFADLIILHKRLPGPSAWETKRKGEPVTDVQLQFEKDWKMGNGWYGRGDYDDAYQWLQARGLIA